MQDKKWEIGAGRITTNFLGALVDAVYIRKRWKEFFPHVHLEGFIFNKDNLYVSIWSIYSKDKAIEHIYKNHEYFFKKLIPLFEKENESLWREFKSIKNEIETIGKNRESMIKVHEKLLHLFGTHAIYTPLVRFCESALKRHLNERGYAEEEISKFINPTYKGTQFYLKQGLIDIANKILQHPNNKEIIENISLGNIPREEEILEHLEKLKNEYGWIKAYINFYKEIEIQDLIKDLDIILKDPYNKYKEEKTRVETPGEIEEFMQLLNFVIDMKNKIQNVQAYFFNLGNKFYSLVSKEIGINISEIEWLTNDEVSGYIDGFSHDKEILDMIMNKRKQGVLIDPRSGTIITDEDLIRDIFEHQKINIEEIFGGKSDKIIKGNFINPKEISGEVFLALSHEDLNKKSLGKDHILVTMAVTPEYTPYLTKFKAVVSNEGGIASHGAIVAREMGISMILGAQNATKNLKDGDKIVMREDGTVELIL